MTNTRKKYNEPANARLLAEVDCMCPLCNTYLHYMKSGKEWKHYQLAHIYPLNPKLDERLLLKNEARLSDDPNDEKNIIPLCGPCHGVFDTPRTVEGYRQLYEIKKKLIGKTLQDKLSYDYKIQDELNIVIAAIYQNPSSINIVEINYDPKELESKLDDTMSSPTHFKIKSFVTNYYSFIRERLAILDREGTSVSEIISMQVKAYYTHQNSLKLPQQAIFENIVRWINSKTSGETVEGAEIMASFFIQNCEVFK